MRGRWGFGRQPAQTSPFEYVRESKNRGDEADVSSSSSDEDSEESMLVDGGYVGFFEVAGPGGSFEVRERLELRFERRGRGVVVEATGSNQYGAFAMRGRCGLDGAKLALVRRYATQDEASSPSKVKAPTRKRGAGRSKRRRNRSGTTGPARVRKPDARRTRPSYQAVTPSFGGKEPRSQPPPLEANDAADADATVRLDSHSTRAAKRQKRPGDDAGRPIARVFELAAQNSAAAANDDAVPRAAASPDDDDGDALDCANAALRTVRETCARAGLARSVPEVPIRRLSTTRYTIENSAVKVF